MNSTLFKLLTITGVVFLGYFNLENWGYLWLTSVIFILFFWFSGENYQLILKEKFGFKNKIINKIFGIFFALIIFSFLGGILLVFWRFNYFTLALVMLASGYLGIFLSKDITETLEEKEAEEKSKILLEKNYYLALYIISVIFAFFTLWSSRIEGSIITPWQFLPNYFIYLYFILLLLSGFLIFSKYKKNVVLIILITQFVLTFSYLPLSHKYFWGADGWRHGGVINNIISQETLEIQNFSQNPNWLEKINPGIFSYSQFWFINAVLVGPLQIDLVKVLAWFNVILAGILLPLLIYKIGLALKFSERAALFLAWVSLFPFSIQAIGSFSLPANFGFLIFLFFLLLLLKRFSNKKSGQFSILILFLLLSIFGYSLYSLLMIISFVLAELLNKLNLEKVNKNLFFFILVAVFSIIPILEFSTNQAKIDSQSSLSIKKQFVQVIGNLSGYYLVNGPRSHTIETGNIFFNQMPADGFIPNGLTFWRGWIIVFTIIFFLISFWGIKHFWQSKEKQKIFLVILGLAFWFDYLFLRYFFTGEHLLTRRLDAVLAFFALIFFMQVVKNNLEKNIGVTTLIILFLSIGITSSYSLGPFSRVMSNNEYLASKYIWSEIKDESKYCVIADVFPLLALEEISYKKVIGGGFPIDQHFSQKELMEILSLLEENTTTEEVLEKAKEITGANSCFLVKSYKEDFLLNPVAKFNDLAVYQF